MPRLMRDYLAAASAAALACSLAGCGSGSVAPVQPNYASFTPTPTVSSERGAVQGVVRDRNGTAVPGATVTVNSYRRAAGATYFSVTTNADGTYAIGNMVPGTYTLRVSKPPVGETTGQDVTVAAGQVTPVPPIVLTGELPPTTGRIVGRVTAEEGGVPLEGVTVRAVHESHTAEAITNAAGEFTLGSLPPATYQVTATRGGFSPKTIEVVVAAGQDARADIALAALGSRAYVGSSQCRTCHQAIYDDEQKSGHPHKLTKIENGQPPAFPFSSVPQPPTGYSWDDITYVIGGFGWKARFIDRQGYIITGNAVQYNRANQQWVPYEAAKPVGTKPYDCGECHTTGWTLTGAAGPHQDNLPGMFGTFSEPGVTCEACHGPGSNHVVTRSRLDIELDRSSELCGKCHFRDPQHRILATASGGKGFIQHHEQYDEMVAARHASLRCVDCHSPHKSTIYKQGGVTATCQSCHPMQAVKINHVNFGGSPTCVECHMPRASKSAISTNIYAADLRTHIFKIKTDAVGQSDMWYTSGSSVFANGYVTLDFACYGCHTDENGVGGGGTSKTLAELSQKARGMHQ